MRLVIFCNIRSIVIFSADFAEPATSCYKKVKSSSADVLICCCSSSWYTVTPTQTKQQRRADHHFLKGAYWFSAVRYLPLHSTHACTLGINSLISEPQAGVNVLDVTHRVAIFDVRYTHPVYLLLHTGVQLFLN